MVYSCLATFTSWSLGHRETHRHLCNCLTDSQQGDMSDKDHILSAPPPGFPASLSPLFSRSASSIPLLPRKAFDASLSDAIRKEASSSGSKGSKGEKGGEWPPSLEASVHLLNDDLNAAHDIVTDREDDDACNVSHALLHRREGEWWNSLYWARQLDHPFVQQMYAGGKAGCVAFFERVRDTAAAAGGKRSGGRGADAAQQLEQVQTQQEKELKGLVRLLWLEHQGRAERT